MRRIGELRKLSHLAWVLREIVLIATVVREHGRCLGDLRAQHVVLGERGLERLPSRWHGKLVDTVRMRTHERRGHDDSCHLLGVSSASLERLIRAAPQVRGSVLLREAVRDGIDDCVNLRKERHAALRAWERVHGRVPNHTLLVSRVAAVITPQHPSERVLPPAKHSQEATS